MGIVQGFGHGQHQFHRLGPRQTSLFDLGSQTGSVDALADDIDRKLLRGAYVIYRNDVGVVENSGDSLCREALTASDVLSSPFGRS
jgi:hypothetical protein